MSKFYLSAVSKHLLIARIVWDESRGPAPARPMRDGTSSLVKRKKNGLSVVGKGEGRDGPQDEANIWWVNSDTVLLSVSAGQRCKAWDEEMQAREWDHVYC